MVLEHVPALNSMRIVLASASPRRREILQLIRLKFEVVESEFEENLPKTTGVEYARDTALHKGLSVARQLGEEGYDLIIAADTVVQLDSDIMEKPGSREQAAGMLTALSGRRHQVHTGVAMLVPASPPITFVETTDVWFASISPAAIQAYVSTGECDGKAGAYGIQGAAACFVEKIQGCYFNVVGFPLHAFSLRVAQLMEAKAVCP